LRYVAIGDCSQSINSGNGEVAVCPRSIPIGVQLTRAIWTRHRRSERSDPARSQTGNGPELSGATYNEQGDNDRAIADLSEAIPLDPTSAMALDHRGSAHNDKDDHDRAIADYDGAIQLSPKRPVAYFTRGLSYLFAASFEKALADFNEANANAPYDAYLALWTDIAS
jgi:tetratricopeptide (TPR) repeat protein